MATIVLLWSPPALLLPVAVMRASVSLGAAQVKLNWRVAAGHCSPSQTLSPSRPFSDQAICASLAAALAKILASLALALSVCRARLGRAMAVRMPTMATAIINSTRLKPALPGC